MLDVANATQEKILRSLVSKGNLDPLEAEKAKARISWTQDPVIAAQDADFVSESVTEDLELKKQVWAQFGELCPEHALFTTNTSYLLPSMFAEATGRPGRFCAFHFHDVFTANVVDIMPHPGTEAWVVEFLKAMGKKLRHSGLPHSMLGLASKVRRPSSSSVLTSTLCSTT